MDYKWKLLASLLTVLVCLILLYPTAAGDTHLNLGLEISGHLIPYLGISHTIGNREAGVNLGLALPHNLLGTTEIDFGYQGTVYYRYAFVNTNYYPKLQFKALFSPPSGEEEEFLLMVGGGLQYLDYVRGVRWGGGLELNLALPVSALDRFAGPIPYLSLESSYEFW